MNTQTLLIGNWKMNLTPHDASLYARKLREEIPTPRATQVWVAPMTVCLAHVIAELRDSAFRVGAQNVHWANSGAFTGETSPTALADLGAHFTIVGHSERRTYFGETSETVAQRMRAALLVGLTPVVCIGETESERSANRTTHVLREQLEPIFAQLDNLSAERVVLAYEPVWAIGTGKVASEREIEDTHGFIHSLWREQRYTSEAAVLYGGSVTPQNFPSIVRLPGVRGALVGGASIKLDQWKELIAIAEG
jgi:triosephosphate isomerase